MTRLPPTKIEADPVHPAYIRTVRGEGYPFNPGATRGLMAIRAAATLAGQHLRWLAGLFLLLEGVTIASTLVFVL